ncbi:MAG: hypothetical protein JSV88_00105 [Candidatus Aminicenantes bacterium]|nr:MAG: hypothetical protein JSV88_00105 [Candidatus Aminicenantes bacterium]
MKRITTLILVFVGLIFLIACDDPDESGIPNGKDFKNYQLSRSGNNFIADIYFYADLTLSEFFFYFSTDSDVGAEFLIKCRRDGFRILKESAPNSGLFNILKYNGTPVLSGDHYRLEFPISALELSFSNEWNICYWFFAMDGGDRMPDSGCKSYANVL